MNKLLFILIALISTTLNLSGQNYVIPIKHLNVKNLAAVLNGIIKDPSITCVANPEKNEILLSANNEDYLIIQKLISELDYPMPKVTLEVWDGEKWLY